MDLFYNWLWGSTAYWAWIGTLYLIILTYQDYKRKMLVDDRLNYFMMGITFSLLSHVRRPIWYVLALIVVVLVCGYGLTKLKALGSADIKTIGWVLYGLMIIGLYQTVTYLVLFGGCVGVYAVAKFWIFRYKEATPFYPVILIPFFINCLLWSLYI